MLLNEQIFNVFNTQRIAIFLQVLVISGSATIFKTLTQYKLHTAAFLQYCLLATLSRERERERVAGGGRSDLTAQRKRL